MTYYYCVRAQSSEALESAPIFLVKCGKSKRAAEALADVSVKALQDNDLYFCVKSAESSLFVLQLLQQNPFREQFCVKIENLCKLLTTSANVAHVENLSPIFKANLFHLLRSVRGAKCLNYEI